MTGFVPDPPTGRVYTTARTVRSADATPSGRLRLDGLARYLQEAAEDDVADAGLDEPCDWLLRKSSVVIRGYPELGEAVALRTFCSALGPRWAERTTTVAGEQGDLIQARAVWVAVSREGGAPVPLGPGFRQVYGASSQGRVVSARLFHPAPDPASQWRPWPLRASDFDVAGHVNNAVHWAAMEDALAQVSWLPARAGIEYHRPILPACEPVLVADHSPGHLSAWLMTGASRLASARLTPLAAG